MYTIFENLLKLKNCKAADVSRATGISSGVLSEWKKGKYTLKADKLQKIADYFGVTVEYLMTGNDASGNVPNYDRGVMDVIDMYSRLNKRDKDIVTTLMQKMLE